MTSTEGCQTKSVSESRLPVYLGLDKAKKGAFSVSVSNALVPILMIKHLFHCL